MTSDRRFSDDEVAFILEQAAAAEAATEGDSDSGTALASRGMTLQQLTDVAREAGLSTEAVVRAAGAVARGDMVATRSQNYAGLPVGVARTIEFDRAVSDSEWERLVVGLRETFQARGVLRAEGSFRTWSNGNLQAMLEPTARGHRLRLVTRKGDARIMLGMGVAGLGAAALSATAIAMSTAPLNAGAWLGPTMLALMGAFGLARAVITLPIWARTRAKQMEQFADTASRILDESHAQRSLASSTSQSRIK